MIYEATPPTSIRIKGAMKVASLSSVYLGLGLKYRTVEKLVSEEKVSIA